MKKEHMVPHPAIARVQAEQGWFLWQASLLDGWIRGGGGSTSVSDLEKEEKMCRSLFNFGRNNFNSNLYTFSLDISSCNLESWPATTFPSNVTIVTDPDTTSWQEGSKDMWWAMLGWLNAGRLALFLGDSLTCVCYGPHSMLFRLDVSDSDWWLARRFVRSGEEVEDTGDDPLAVELVTLHLPVDPVPTLLCPLSGLPMPTLL